jgi:GAF domain-containing protein
MISTDRLAEVFVAMADTLVDEFDLIDFLHTLTTHVVEVTGAAEAGVLLLDGLQGLSQVAASSEDTELLELLQIQHAEGPCVEAVRNREPVLVPDISSTFDRWPLFAPRAFDAGFQSVHAFPMRLRDQMIGSLNVFGRVPAGLAPGDVPVLQALADLSTIAILHEQSLHRAEVLTEQLQFALSSRVTIEQAKGAVARALGVGVDAAFEILRSHARTEQMRLTDLSLLVLSDRSFMMRLGQVKP